jgi:hypothetical protein
MGEQPTGCGEPVRVYTDSSLEFIWIRSGLIWGGFWVTPRSSWDSWRDESGRLEGKLGFFGGVSGSVRGSAGSVPGGPVGRAPGCWRGVSGRLEGRVSNIRGIGGWGDKTAPGGRILERFYGYARGPISGKGLEMRRLKVN